MDHDLMWSNDFEGEAFLEISKLHGIPHDLNIDNRSLEELKKFELSLTHPKGLKYKLKVNFFRINFLSFSRSKSNYRNIRITHIR